MFRTSYLLLQYDGEARLSRPSVVFFLFLFYLCDVRANECLITAIGRCPINGVANDRLNVGNMICRICLVTGLEIENFSISATECRAAAERLAALVPADEYQMLGLGDTERLGVHLLVRNFNISAESAADRVRRIADPQTFEITVFTPADIAGCTHEQLERLGMVSRMERDEAHSLEDVVANACGNLIGDEVMRHVSPPKQDVGVAQDLFGQTAFGIVERDGSNRYLVRAQKIGDSTVDAVWVDRADRFHLFFVFEFVKYRDFDHGKVSFRFAC